MAKKVIQMYDKYQSTTKVYPLIIGDSLTEDAMDIIKSEVASKYEITQVVVEDSEPVGFSIKDTENNVTYNIDLSGGGKQLYQHNLEITRNQSFKLFAEIINDSDVQFDFDTLFTYLPKATDMADALFKTKGLHVWGFGLTGATNTVDVSNHSDFRQIIGRVESGTNLIVVCFEATTGSLSSWWQGNSKTDLTITDTVVEL